MALSVTLGSKSLIQLGVSVSDLGLIISTGHKFGNWIATKKNDETLFEILMERPDVILKRRGILNTAEMENKWHRADWVYRGELHSTGSQNILNQDLSAFSWLMVVFVAAIDPWLDNTRLKALLVSVFMNTLGDDEVEESLRTTLDVNIRSWRELGCARQMVVGMIYEMRQCRLKETGEEILPGLNHVEEEELKQFMVWFLIGKDCDLTVVSVSTFAIAKALQYAGIKINVGGDRAWEAQPTVTYSEGRLTAGYSSRSTQQSQDVLQALELKASIVSYPRNTPSAMIHTAAVNRETINYMIRAWSQGEKAAKRLRLSAKSSSFAQDAELSYALVDQPKVFSVFRGEVAILASNAFPGTFEEISLEIERIIEGHSAEEIAELNRHVSLEYLSRNASSPVPAQRVMALWSIYQALVFGFYYKLFEPLLCLDMVKEDAYFRGIWGDGSKTLLAMCTDFSRKLREGRAKRTHVVYMLSSMYGGSTKMYQDSSRKGLVATFGPISVVSYSILRTTDNPKDIGKFFLIDRPIMDLAGSETGELYAGTTTRLRLDRGQKRSTPQKTVRVSCHAAPSKPWTVHARMGQLYDEDSSTVVMAARFGGRLVGWFSPGIADAVFLSSCYVASHDNQHDGAEEETMEISNAFLITDEEWERACVPAPIPNSSTAFGFVQSHGCPTLRYAAAGLFGGLGEELAISGRSLDATAAFGRVEGQESGIVIL